MYESFGAVAEEPKVTFRLFLPDNSRDSNQYSRGDDPHIISIRVIGDFQQQIEQTNWDYTSGLTLNKKPHPKGWLWEASIPNLSDGFYEYKYFVQFENGTTRKCSNPYSKYDGSAAEHSAFVIGGNDMVVRSLANRLPIQDLVIYELMLDDFTAQYRTARAPLDAVWDKLDYLQHLGVNAIEFMPRTAWPERRSRPFLTVFLPTNAKRKPLRLNKLGSSDVTTLLNQEFTTVLLATSRFLIAKIQHRNPQNCRFQAIMKLVSSIQSRSTSTVTAML